MKLGSLIVLPVSGPARCWCACHHGSVVDLSPDLRDPIAAVTACRTCLNSHCIALISEWPIIPEPNPLVLNPLVEWVDPDVPEDGSPTGAGG